MRYSRAGFLHKSEAYGQVTWGLANKIEISKAVVIILRFRREFLIKRTISMRLKIKLTLSGR
jgi:hypothetical protein